MSLQTTHIINLNNKLALCYFGDKQLVYLIEYPDHFCCSDTLRQLNPEKIKQFNKWINGNKIKQLLNQFTGAQIYLENSGTSKFTGAQIQLENSGLKDNLYSGTYLHKDLWLKLVEWANINLYVEYCQLLSKTILEISLCAQIEAKQLNEEINLKNLQLQSMLQQKDIEIQNLKNLSEKIKYDTIYCVRNESLEYGYCKCGQTSKTIKIRDLDTDSNYNLPTPWLIDQAIIIKVSNGPKAEAILFDLLKDQRVYQKREIFRNFDKDFYTEMLQQAAKFCSQGDYVFKKQQRSLSLKRIPQQDKIQTFKRTTYNNKQITIQEYVNQIKKRIQNNDFNSLQRMIDHVKTTTGYGDDLQELFDKQKIVHQKQHNIDYYHEYRYKTKENPRQEILDKIQNKNFFGLKEQIEIYLQFSGEDLTQFYEEAINLHKKEYHKNYHQQHKTLTQDQIQKLKNEIIERISKNIFTGTIQKILKHKFYSQLNAEIVCTTVKCSKLKEYTNEDLQQLYKDAHLKYKSQK